MRNLKKILIVDDDPDIIEPLSLLLESEGYVVESTLEGEGTFSKTEEFGPNLILLDILMSGSDGRIICKELKSNAKAKHIPIVMMSAHPGAKYDSVNCGADDFIAKPFEVEELLEVITKFIQE